MVTTASLDRIASPSTKEFQEIGMRDAQSDLGKRQRVDEIDMGKSSVSRIRVAKLQHFSIFIASTDFIEALFTRNSLANNVLEEYLWGILKDFLDIWRIKLLRSAWSWMPIRQVLLRC